MNQIFTIGSGARINDIVTGASWDYDEICRQVTNRTLVLKDLGVKRGDDILISHGGTPEFLADLLAVWQVGGCATCLNTDLTVGEQKNIEDFLKPALILSGSADTTVLNFSTKVVNLTTFSKNPGGELIECQLQPNDPALILFTSGTTAQPKGVVHTKNSLENRLRINLENIDVNVLDRTLSVLSTHFVSGLVSGTLTTLFAGKEVYLFQTQGIDRAIRLGGVIDDFEITFLNSTPSFWNIVLKVGNPPTKNSIRQVSVGASPLNKKTWQAIIKWSGINNVFNMYGATETGGWNIAISSADHAPETELIGMPWSGEVAILTAQGDRETTGEGEILIKTPCLMKGYLHRQDLTDHVIKEGWYHSGDLGRIDDHGQVWYIGRSDFEINRAGNMVSPEEIDLLLARHPAIKEVCAFGVPDLVSGETVACAVTLKEGKKIKAIELRLWCEQRIRPVCVPERWFFIKNIPKTPGGKYNREKVAKACLEIKD